MNLVRLGFKENRYRELKILNGKTIFQRCRPIQEDILIIFCIACHSGQGQIFAKKKLNFL